MFYFTIIRPIVSLLTVQNIIHINVPPAESRPRRRRISPTYRVEFPWSRSRRLTSQAAAEFFPRRRRRI